MLTCPRCRQPLEETDNFCRQCGRALKTGTGFWYTHSGIILLTILLGPFALIPLYFSKMMGAAAKTIYTAVIVLFTVYLAYTCWQVFVLMQQVMSTTLQLPY